MLYMKTIVLIAAMAVLLLTAALRGLFGENPSKPDAWTTVAFVLATCAFGALLVWSGR